MPSQKRLSEIIHAIYAAAEAPELWEPLLDTVAEEIGSSMTLFIAVSDQGIGTNIAVATRTDPEAVRLYNEHWGAQDPWLLSGHESLTRPGAVVLSEHLVDDRTLFKTSFYNDFMRQHQMLYSLVATVASQPGLTAGISFHYPRGSRPCVHEDVRLLELLVPHFSQALRLHSHLSLGRSADTVSGVVLDRAATGFILVDGRGRVTRLNTTAEAMLRRGDALRMSDGRVVATKPGVDAKLQAAIAAAATTALKDGSNAGTTLLLPRGLGRLPYAASLLPVSGAGQLFGHHRAAVAIIVADPQAKPRFDATALQSTFGWTAAESRVAMSLAAGLKPRDIAERNGVSFETVRTQVKSVFAKCGIRSQAELVRMLMNVIATLSLPLD